MWPQRCHNQVERHQPQQQQLPPPRPHFEQHELQRKQTLNLPHQNNQQRPRPRHKNAQLRPTTLILPTLLPPTSAQLLQPHCMPRNRCKLQECITPSLKLANVLLLLALGICHNNATTSAICAAAIDVPRTAADRQQNFRLLQTPQYSNINHMENSANSSIRNAEKDANRSNNYTHSFNYTGINHKSLVALDEQSSPSSSSSPLMSLPLLANETFVRHSIVDAANLRTETEMKITAAAAAASAAASTAMNMQIGNELKLPTNVEPIFDFGMPRNITGHTGLTEAIIKCRVDQLNDKSVSWIRKRDLHILTVGTATYTSDKRFEVTASKDLREWTLHVKAPQQRDTGIYECQVNTEPKISMAFQLNVIEIAPDARAVIGGPPDLHFKTGSAIILNCVVQQPSIKYIGPIYWYRGEHMITPFEPDMTGANDDIDADQQHYRKDNSIDEHGHNYGYNSANDAADADADNRGADAGSNDLSSGVHELTTNDITDDFTSRIAMESQLGDTLKSRLRISNAQTTDTGNYTCQPTTARSASVMVHVINDENPAAMQKSGAVAAFGFSAGDINLLVLPGISLLLPIIVCGSYRHAVTYCITNPAADATAVATAALLPIVTRLREVFIFIGTFVLVAGVLCVVVYRTVVEVVGIVSWVSIIAAAVVCVVDAIIIFFCRFVVPLTNFKQESQISSFLVSSGNR